LRQRTLRLRLFAKPFQRKRGLVILSLSKDAGQGRSCETDVTVYDGAQVKRKHDEVVVEEPLELRLSDGRETRTLAITMRTPGNDFELAAGFAFNESLLRSRDALAGMTYCVDEHLDPAQQYNIVTIQCGREDFDRNAERLERHFTTNSSCGICGSAQLQSMRDLGMTPLEDDLQIAAPLLYALPERMREQQRLFTSTGGLHAAALFDEDGSCVTVREDVGRHNTFDKLVGWGFLNGRLPFRRSIALASGRASYEIVQKTVAARIPILCSVSAPSSLAIDVAREFNITLVGFLRDDRANVYAGAWRITE
jgi:FdhD protein